MPRPDATLLREPDIREKLMMVHRHLTLLEERGYSERHALHTMKLRMGWYGKSIPGIKPLRERFRTASSVAEMRKALEEMQVIGRETSGASRAVPV
jgi:tRNA-dihydrouridine synthase